MTPTAKVIEAVRAAKNETRWGWYAARRHAELFGVLRHFYAALRFEIQRAKRAGGAA